MNTKNNSVQQDAYGHKMTSIHILSLSSYNIIP